MEPSTVSAPAGSEVRAKSAEDRIALLSSLLQKLEEAAQNDGLAETAPDSHQSQLVRVRLGMASSLFTALRAKHPSTANHCFRVALGVSSWAAARKLSDDYRDAIEVAALLHDVGKIGVPDNILGKPVKLNAEESLAMERSRVVGYEILSACSSTTLLQEIMLYSAAWFDGSKHGYDRCGTNLPLGSRLLAIVDAFDSMTTDHVYRPALSRERAMAELSEGAGTQFDPELVREFCELLTGGAGNLQSNVARRWLQQLSPETSDSYWTIRQPILTCESARPDAAYQESLVESLCDGVVFVDRNLKILRWNAAAERLTGIVGHTVLDKQWSPALVRLRDERGRIVSDTDCPATLALRTGAQTLRRFILANRKSDRIAVDLQVTPVLGGDAVPCGVSLVFHDISSQTSLEEKMQSLHERASRDPLTKAANRAEFNNAFPAFIETHLQAGRPCGLVICDIDHFKRINDSHGHQAGDEALVLFTSILQRFARPGDLVARYGGEEFVLLCSDCDNAAATRRADEIRRLIGSTPMASLNNTCITASFGVTELQGGDTPETFLNRADRALLQAKEAGRNMVVQLGTGIKVSERRTWGAGIRGWFGVKAGEVLLDRTLVTAVPLKVTAEKLRGFVADHQAQIGKVDGDRVTLTIDSQFIPLVRRTSDRAVPFQIELMFFERQLPIEGRPGQSALRTLIQVSIRPKRQRDRRQRDSIERARQLLVSLKSYLMAQDYLAGDVPQKEASKDGLLRSSQRLLSLWLRN